MHHGQKMLNKEFHSKHGPAKSFTVKNVQVPALSKELPSWNLRSSNSDTGPFSEWRGWQVDGAGTREAPRCLFRPSITISLLRTITAELQCLSRTSKRHSDYSVRNSRSFIYHRCSYGLFVHVYGREYLVTAITNGPLFIPRVIYEYGQPRWNDIRENPVPVPLYPPQNLT
jgi:hypothetical protein